MPEWRFWRRAEGARAQQQAAQQIYCELVNRARQPWFYRSLGVPDSPEGRFEMVGLHCAIMIRNLRRAGAPGIELGQELFDLMFADMDESFRHLGVGDLSVGKHVKRLARNFYARMAALDEALARPKAGAIADPAADQLGSILSTNVYHGGPAPAASQLEQLTTYIIGFERTLADQSTEELLAGRIPDFALDPLPQEQD